MESFRKELWFSVPTRRAFINVTADVQDCLRESGIQEGLLLVNAMHITASVFINDDESGLHHDYDDWLEELAPHAPISNYRHNRTDDTGTPSLPMDIKYIDTDIFESEYSGTFGAYDVHGQLFYNDVDHKMNNFELRNPPMPMMSSRATSRTTIGCLLLSLRRMFSS